MPLLGVPIGRIDDEVVQANTDIGLQSAVGVLGMFRWMVLASP
jgi:hypothetical protein